MFSSLCHIFLMGVVWVLLVLNRSKSKVSGELAVKIITGDKLVSNEFVKINYSWLLFVVRRKFAQSNNHEDIVQDTFMLVIKKLPTKNIWK